LNREWQSKLRHLEIKVKSAADSQRIAVEKALEKAKKIHAVELSTAVREAAMRAGQAAAKKAGSGGGLNAGSTAASSRARVERRDNMRAGGGGEITKRQEEAVLAPLTADEIANGTDQPETVSLSTVGGGGGGRDGGGGAPEVRLLNLKLKNQTDEAAYLRTRVTDLEVVVKTMRIAIEGSLEEGAGEKNFSGWRQVYAVQYPWLRDRKREDPARYSYMKPNKVRVPKEGF